MDSGRASAKGRASVGDCAPVDIRELAGSCASPSDDRASAPAVVVDRVTVKPGRIAFDVRVPAARHRTVGAPLAKRCLAACPDLARHACVNGEADTFGPVIATTSLPHLLEHLAIDYEAHAADGRAARTIGHASHAVGDAPDATTYVGATTWTDEARGCATVELSFVDDLATLDAFNRAVRFVNETVAELDGR